MVDWLDGYTQIQPKEDELEILQSAKIKPARGFHDLTHEEAIKAAIESAKNFTGVRNPFPPQREPFHRFPYLVFDEIDEAVFGGVLKGNVHLRCDVNLPYGLAGMTSRFVREQCPRTIVDLSRDLIAEGSRKRLVEVLLHQMIHAYLIQCCGYKRVDADGNGHDLGHGIEFSTVAFLIANAWPGLEGTNPFPALLGVYSHGEPYDGWNPSIRLPIPRVGGPASSLCVSAGEPFKRCKTMFEQVKRTTAMPEIDLDEKCPMDKEGVRR